MLAMRLLYYCCFITRTALITEKVNLRVIAGFRCLESRVNVICEEVSYIELS